MPTVPNSGHYGTQPTPADAPDGTLLFEVAWEVCTQVGGIYTVLRSKAPATVQRWGEAYCLIGPYREASARIELEPQPPPPLLKDALDTLLVSGVRVCFGRWLITGRPQVILIDVDSARVRLGEIKYLLWKDGGVASPDGDFEYDEVIAFGWAVAELLTTLQRAAGGREIVAQFHEWQGGAALPLLRARQARIATVFTTHATLAGRNLCAANANIYENLGQINAGAAAREAGYAHRHALEGTAAQCAHVFTTVSAVTGLEAEYFLGRKPDLLLPNGLNIARFAAPHEFQVLHRAAKDALHEFVMGHFFPSYTFDLDRTLYIFTAGRYEYRNKGLDVFIEALHELNRRMQADGTTTTVVAFIITRAAHRSFNKETLQRQAMFSELRDTCEGIKEDMGRRLFQTVAGGRLPKIDDLLDEYAAVRLKRVMYAWRGGPPPTIVTHDLMDDGRDPVLCHLRHRHLINLEGDRVKVVFHPEFLSAASPILGVEYDDFVRGCHCGVFPSYYEPWGYTPMECVVSGIPAITSDLSGFGGYLAENFPDHDACGMYVARRHSVPFDATVGQVVEWLYALTRMSRRERISLRNKVEAHAEHFDWTNMGRHYAAAHRLALERCYGATHAAPVEREIKADLTVDTAARRPLRRRPRKPRGGKGA